jgi:acyl-CoA synthetase (AMP-forming)/AMP-acid ligase II
VLYLRVLYIRSSFQEIKLFFDILTMAVPSEVCGESPSNEPKPIVSRFQTFVEEHPENLAIVCLHQPADLYGFDSLSMECSTDEHAPYLRWSYEILSRSVMQLKESLVARGAVSEVVLFSFCESQVESVISMLAAYTMGWVHVPIGPENLNNLQEVQHMVTVVTSSIQPSKSIFLVGKEHSISQVDKLHVQTETIKIGCEEDHESWVSFSSLVGNHVQLPEEFQSVTLPSRENSVFFTSGTTSLPKACLINAGQWFHALEPSLSLGSVAAGDRVSVAVPIYHAFGYICTVMPLLRGSCVILIGPKFSPQGMGTALNREACTHVALVPTIAHTLLQMAEDQEIKAQSLKSMVFAGMTVSPSIVRKCQEVLGISLVENFYGMTEGVFISTGPVGNLSTTTLNDTVSVGKPVSGAKLRVCDIDSHSCVPIGVKGVLHFSGSTTIEHYLNAESEDFYDSDGRRWFVTGDQAFVGPDKRLYIVGRHKDMIVRGGENLSPSKIEEVLTRKPELLALEPQVVAGDDDIAGEVPVVVTKGPAPHVMEDMMHETIREHLGVRYLPRAYISLDSLGLNDFPRSASGKIQKAKLRSLVADFIQSESSGAGDEQEPSGQLLHDVVTVWSRLLGIQASQLDINTPISHLADSILMVSARAKVKSETGLSVSLDQWLAAPTIADQIKALGTPESKLKDLESVPEEVRSEPPSTADMVHLGGDESAFNATKEAVEKTIADQGFAWEDVADVFPCTDFINILCQSRVINTWNIRTTIVSQNASVQVRE